MFSASHGTLDSVIAKWVSLKNVINYAVNYANVDSSNQLSALLQVYHK